MTGLRNPFGRSGGVSSPIAMPAIGATTLTGKAQPYAAVEVYKNASTTVLGVGLADETGAWSLTVPAVAGGDIYRVENGAGIYVPAILGPLTASYPVDTPFGSTIAAVTGLAPGETVTGVFPNDGRFGFTVNALTKGASAASTGTVRVSVSTNLGRTLALDATATAVVAALGPTASTFIAGSPSGSMISRITGVPSGVTPTFTPTNGADGGKVFVGGNETDGWKLIAGAVPADVGSIAGTLAAGAMSAAHAVTAEQPPQFHTLPYQHYFASNRTRSPTSQGLPNVSGNVYTLHEIYLGQTPYAMTEFSAFMPSHYTRSVPEDNENAAPAPFTIKGVALVFGATRTPASVTSTQLPFIAAKDAAITPTNSIEIDPSVNPVGALAMAPVAIPAGSHLWVKTYLNHPGAMVSGYEVNAAANESAQGSATDSLGGKLLDGSVSTSTSGRINFLLYGPEFCTAKGTDGRPVALGVGDSIWYGKNEIGASFGHPGSGVTGLTANGTAVPAIGNGGAAGGIFSRGLNDEAAGPKWLGANMCLPGTGPADIVNGGRIKTAFKWDAIKLATTVLNGNVSRQLMSEVFSEHGTNSAGGDYAEFVAMMQGLIRDRYRTEWPGIRIHQATMIPKATTVNGYQDLAGQRVSSNESTTGLRFKYNDELLSTLLGGVADTAINTFQHYAASPTGTNRHFWKVINRTATLAVALAGGASYGNFMVNEADQLKVGDFISLEVETANTSGAGGSGGVVTAISGTGPYQINVNTPLAVSAAGMGVGAKVKPHYASDSSGLHPGTTANIEAMVAITDLKARIITRGSGRPRLDPYYRPVLVNPVTVTLKADGSFSNQTTPFDENTDIIVKAPAGTKILRFQASIYGGRNIIVEDLHLLDTLSLLDFTGTAYVASTCIDVFLAGGANPSNRVSDCMRFKGKRRSDGTLTAEAIVDNCNFGGCRGSDATNHTDCVQFLNGCVLRKFTWRWSTADSNYQVLIVQNQPGLSTSSEVQIIEIDHVNGFYNNNPGDSSTSALYMGSGKHPGLFHEFYLDWRAGTSLTQAIVPNANTAGQAQYANQPDGSGNFVTFPAAMELAGRVKKGRPPSGDFCPKASVAKG